MKYKKIEVVSAGTLYEGILIGMDETDIYLKGHLRWIILPLERVTSLKIAGEKESFNLSKIVEADFYKDHKNNSCSGVPCPGMLP